MKDKAKSSDSSKYKMGFFVLLVVVVLALLVFALDFFGDSRFNEGVLAGQSNAALIIANTAASTGAVTISVDNSTNLTLIPSEAIQVVQSQLVQGLVGAIQQNGFVAIGPEDSPIYLVQAQINEDALAQASEENSEEN